MVVQAGQALAVEPLRPLVRARRADPNALDHLPLLDALGAQQHDPSPLVVAPRGCRSGDAAFEFLLLLGMQLENGNRPGQGACLGEKQYNKLVPLNQSI